MCTLRAMMYDKTRTEETSRQAAAVDAVTHILPCSTVPSYVQTWYVSEVLSSSPSQLRVHFLLWHRKHDWDVPRNQFALWIAPLHTHTEAMVAEEGCDFVSEFSCAVCGEGGDILCCDSCSKVRRVTSHCGSHEPEAR